MSDLPLRLPRGHAPPGDPLGRVYTPQQVADAIVYSLPLATVRTVTEPSVGGGAFVRAVRKRWPEAQVTGVDIDPDAPGLDLVDEAIVGDWTRTHAWDVDDLVVGNPPFGKAVTMRALCEHVVCSIERSLTCALILPLPTLGSVQFQDEVLARYPLAWLQPLRPRVWDRVREVAVFAWRTYERHHTAGRAIPAATHSHLRKPLAWKEQG